MHVPPSSPLTVECLSTKIPITVCEPPDTHLRLFPAPALEIDFENSVSCELTYSTDLIMESESTLVEIDESMHVLCQNCDVTLESATHTCMLDERENENGETAADESTILVGSSAYMNAKKVKMKQDMEAYCRIYSDYSDSD